MVQEHLQESKPSQTDHFSYKVRFFLALKTRDMCQVKTLVEKDPGLIHAQTERGVASEAYYLPFGSTARHWASATGDEPLLTFLLSCGADMNVKDPWGTTPLHLSASTSWAGCSMERESPSTDYRG